MRLTFNQITTLHIAPISISFHGLSNENNVILLYLGLIILRTVMIQALIQFLHYFVSFDIQIVLLILSKVTVFSVLAEIVVLAFLLIE